MRDVYIWVLGNIKWMNYDTIDIITKIMTPLMIFTALLYFFMFYRKDRERQRNIEHERWMLEREQIKSDKVNIDIDNSQVPNQPLGFGAGGFIVLDLPDGQRSIFHDLLKGFEDFAKLKGYSISFSVDNSLSNKIGFKFTINDSGISVSTQKVRQDIQEYINKVKSGEPLEELPVLISSEEHSLVLTQMMNRISFLQHNYNLQKNSIEFYEGLMNKLNSTNNGIIPQPSVFVQTGGMNQPQSYLATNSPGAIQGTNIRDVKNTIKIADSFNERKNQIEDLGKFIDLIKSSEPENKEASKQIVKNLEKVKDELEEEEKPNKENVGKWLKKAKSYLDVAKFGKQVIEFGKGVFESFDLSSIL